MIINDNIYSVVADAAEMYCEKTYYDNCIAQFEISYDGKEWDPISTLITFDWPYMSSMEVCFDWDWCEGQKYIRNIKICHIRDIIMPEDCYIYE